MATLDTLGLPALDTVLGSAAAFMNSVYLPTATTNSVAIGIAAIPRRCPGLAGAPDHGKTRRACRS